MDAFSPDTPTAQVAAAARPAMTTHQSRWGYHACSYEDYLLLKDYHRLLLTAYCRNKRYAAWARKKAHRDGSQPPAKFVGLFDTPTFFDYHKFGCRRDEKLYCRILRAYRAARRPVADPNLVVPLDLSRHWRTEYEELRAAFA